MKIIKIPGVSFSLSRALGIDKVKRKIARETLVYIIIVMGINSKVNLLWSNRVTCRKGREYLKGHFPLKEG